MPKTYEFSGEDLGDVFNGKQIYTDTHEIVAFISRIYRDPKTGSRKYRKVQYAREDENGKVYVDEWNPKFPIHKGEMDIYLPPGKYLVRVFNHGKTKCYGSVTIYNEGSTYTELHSEEMKGSLVSESPLTENRPWYEVIEQHTVMLQQIQTTLSVIIKRLH